MNIIRSHELCRKTGLSRTTIWRLERAGRFPSRLQLGENSVGWLEQEVQAWIESRPRGLNQYQAEECNE